MRATDIDFPIGHARPKPKLLRKCEDCLYKLAVPGHATCTGCGERREQLARELVPTRG